MRRLHSWVCSTQYVSMVTISKAMICACLTAPENTFYILMKILCKALIFNQISHPILQILVWDIKHSLFISVCYRNGGHFKLHTYRI